MKVVDDITGLPKRQAAGESRLTNLSCKAGIDIRYVNT